MMTHTLEYRKVLDLPFKGFCTADKDIVLAGGRMAVKRAAGAPQQISGVC